MKAKDRQTDKAMLEPGQATPIQTKSGGRTETRKAPEISKKWLAKTFELMEKRKRRRS
jgi:hypothetical protein